LGYLIIFTIIYHSIYNTSIIIIFIIYNVVEPTIIMNSNKYSIKYVFTALVILSLSTFLPTIAYAAPAANSDKDWQYTNGNSWAWNYSPQTQINKNNVKDLEVKWLFPVGSVSQRPAAMAGLTPDEGMTAPPLVKNGIVYMLTPYKSIIAVDAKSGKQMWSYQYTVNISAAQKRLPVDISFLRHSHGIRYWESGDAVLDLGLACDIYGVDGKTGKEKLHINDLCLNIPGNLYPYQAYFLNRASAGISTYEKGRQFIVILPGRIHSDVRQVSNGDARHVTIGVSMDAPYKTLWRVFSFPPQDVPTKDWALQECDTGFFKDIPCSEVAAVNRAGLEWDFALPGAAPVKWAGVTGNWGQPVVDEDTGILYTNTGNQGPYSNMTLAPGPRLYGSTIMAIDMNQGKRIWWLQPFPHDPYDYDCNWSGMLVDNPTLGKVYVKGCKDGTFYVMDAKTGKPKYKVDVVVDQAARGQIGSIGVKMPPDGIRAYAPDPKSFYDMREWNWISYPATKPGEKGKYFTLPAAVYPAWTNGVFLTDMSFDPDAQRLILYEGALQNKVLQEYPYSNGNLFTTQGYPSTNSTIVARDIATGKVKWTYFYSYSQQRSAMVVSGGMVFTGFTDNFVRFLDKDTGQLLHQVALGAPVGVGVTIGKDSDGNSKIFVVAGKTGIFSAGLTGPAVPGTLVAIGLSERAQQTVTATTTATTTATATSVSTTTSISTATTSVTNTVTQPAQTSTLTETVGLPAEVTYGAVGIALVAIVAAAVMMTRKRA